jgi:hypothetical protein
MIYHFTEYQDIRNWTTRCIHRPYHGRVVPVAVCSSKIPDVCVGEMHPYQCGVVTMLPQPKLLDSLTGSDVTAWLETACEPSQSHIEPSRVIQWLMT